MYRDTRIVFEKAITDTAYEQKIHEEIPFFRVENRKTDRTVGSVSRITRGQLYCINEQAKSGSLHSLD